MLRNVSIILDMHIPWRPGVANVECETLGDVRPEPASYNRAPEGRYIHMCPAVAVASRVRTGTRINACLRHRGCHRHTVATGNTLTNNEPAFSLDDCPNLLVNC